MLRAFAISIALSTAALAQQPNAPSIPEPPVIIEPADAAALKELIETTIPPRYNGALIRWISGIMQREQARAKAQAEKPAEPQKVD